MKKNIFLMIAIFASIFNYINSDVDFSAFFNDNDVHNVYKVIRVVDGDTIQVDFNGEKEKVRLIGVNTPESVHPDKKWNTEFGKIASDFTKGHLEGKSVRLEFDVQERDKYNRLLAYVWLGDELYNEKLVKEGYAQVATYPPNVKYVDRFKKAQGEARETGRGLWGI